MQATTRPCDSTSARAAPATGSVTATARSPDASPSGASASSAQAVPSVAATTATSAEPPAPVEPGPPTKDYVIPVLSGPALVQLVMRKVGYRAMPYAGMLMAQPDLRKKGPRLIEWVRAQQAKGLVVVTSSSYLAPRSCAELDDCDISAADAFFALSRASAAKLNPTLHYEVPPP